MARTTTGVARENSAGSPNAAAAKMRTWRRVAKVNGSPAKRRSMSAIVIVRAALTPICHTTRHAGAWGSTAAVWANAVTTYTKPQREGRVSSSADSRTPFAIQTTPIREFWKRKLSPRRTAR